MLKRIIVEGLNGKSKVEHDFHPDVNIITGRNGSGKTTLLKMLWYLISGNIERIAPEIYVEFIYLETDDFDLELEYDPKNKIFVRGVFRSLKGKKSTMVLPEEDIFEQFKDLKIPQKDKARLLQMKGFRRLADESEGFNHQVLKYSEKSLFFPTFRRIEGGFNSIYGSQRVGLNDLQSSLSSLSDRLSVRSHGFVASLSTQDVVQLLTTTYAEISSKTNGLQNELSDYITKTIKTYSSRTTKSVQAAESDFDNLAKAQKTLDAIQKEVASIADRREDLLRPLTTLSALISRVFQHKGIRVTDGITLGDATQAISSDSLSAGEKHMLSFLCYNAILNDAVIMIDEPEISLNVDWQRILFPTLLEQKKSNQFIIATHSPFIYSKYSDKELVLNEDKGGK